MSETKRIIELDPVSVISADAQLPVDSPSIGSRRISWPDLLDLILEEAQGAVEAAAESAEASEASRQQADLDAAATAADRVQTGLDRTQTGLDRVAASASATAAAGSAVTALNAIAQAFKGGVAGAAVPAMSALGGDTYRVTSTGISQGKTWGIGDAAIYNGVSGSWTQLAGYYADLDSGVHALLDPIANSRAAANGIVFTGETSTPYATTGHAAALRKHDVTLDFRTVIGINIIFGGYGGGGVSTLAITQYGQGALGMYIVNVGEISPVLVRSTGNEHLPVGTEVRWTITRTGGAWRIYRDGRLDAGPFADETDYEGLQNFIGGVQSGGSLIYASAGSRMLSFNRYNYALTDTEVAALFRSGAPDPVDRGGSMLALNTSAWTNASMGDLTSVTATGFTTTIGNGFALGNPLFSSFVGQRFRIRFALSSVSGDLPLVYMDGAGVALVGANAGANDIIVTATLNSAVARPVFWSTTAASFTISNFSIIPLGTVVQCGPWDGNGGYWPDMSGNGAHVMLGGGATPLIKTVRSEVRPTFFAPDRPVLEVQLTAGQSVTDGDILAEIDATLAYTGLTRVHGLWLLGNDTGTRLYFGGGITIAGTANIALAELGSGGGYLALDAGMPCKASVDNDSGMKIRIRAAFTGTVGVTSKVGLYHLAGGLNSGLVK